MTQGTRVSGNLIHDIGPKEDLFVEVNHGPFMVDHNLFLSEHSLDDWSEGGAYAHNLFLGKVTAGSDLKRDTPWQEEHGTKIAGLAHVEGGDNRFFNNVFIAPAGLEAYDNALRPNFIAGNSFLNGARPSKHEVSPDVRTDFNPGIKIVAQDDQWFLVLDESWIGQPAGPLVTSGLLGKAAVPGMGYVRADGAPYRLDRDLLGHPRDGKPPAAGPLETLGAGNQRIKIWPRATESPTDRIR